MPRGTKQIEHVSSKYSGETKWTPGMAFNYRLYAMFTTLTVILVFSRITLLHSDSIELALKNLSILPCTDNFICGNTKSFCGSVSRTCEVGITDIAGTVFTFGTRWRLCLSGDVETNPGPTTRGMGSQPDADVEDSVSESIKALTCQFDTLNKTITSMSDMLVSLKVTVDQNNKKLSKQLEDIKTENKTLRR